MQVRWKVVGFAVALMLAWGGGAFAYAIGPVSDAGVVTQFRWRSVWRPAQA